MQCLIEKSTDWDLIKGLMIFLIIFLIKIFHW